MASDLPWYSDLPCSTCTAAVGPDGAYVQDDIAFCRPCGVYVLRLLYALLFVPGKVI